MAQWRVEGDSVEALLLSDEILAGAALEEQLRIVLRSATAYHVIRAGGACFHAASGSSGGRGFLLLGASGAGKTTTVTRFPPELTFGDDFSIVARERDRFLVVSSSFPGRERHASSPGAAPLSRIFILRRSAMTELASLTRGEALKSLLSRAFRLDSCASSGSDILATCAAMAESVPTFSLGVSLHESPWEVAWKET